MMSFQEKLSQGKTVHGTMIRFASSPVIVSIARNSGFDFIMVDMEHGPQTIEHLWSITAASKPAGLGLMVRVPSLSKEGICRALDAGVDGVMVPMLETEEQARTLAGLAKYPPQGRRGLSSSGPFNNFSKGWKDAVSGMADANRQTLAIAQIETGAAIKSIDKIARVEGIDVLLIGPNDLAASLGKPGDLMSKEVNDAISKVCDAAVENDKIFAMHAGLNLLEVWVPKGMRLFLNSLDLGALTKGMDEIANQSRKLIGDETQ